MGLDYTTFLKAVSEQFRRKSLKLICLFYKSNVEKSLSKISCKLIIIHLLLENMWIYLPFG